MRFRLRLKSLIRKEFGLPFLGVCFCLMVAALPEVVPLLAEKDGHTWSPVNSARYRRGDTYQYAAWVMKIVQGHIPPSSPSAAEKSNTFSVEIFKLSSMILAAAPSLVVTDPRYIIVITRCLFPAVLFLLCYLLGHAFTKSVWYSLFLGLYMLFYYSAWSILVFSIPVLKALKVFLGYPFVVARLDEYEILNSNFRFLITSVSSCVLMSFVLSLVFFERYRGYLLFGISGVLGVGLAFSYPPQAIVGYLMLAALTASFLVERKLVEFQWLFALGAVTAVAVLSIACAVGLFNVGLDTHSFRQIFSLSTPSTGPRGTLVFCIIAGLKFAIIEALALAAAWRSEALRRWLMVLGFIGILFFLTSFITDNGLITFRLFYRAYAFPWLGFVATAGFVWAFPRAKSMLGRYRRIVHHAVIACLLVILAGVPLAGFVHFSWKQVHRPGSYIKTGQWEAYRWLEENTEAGAVVLAIDWDDVYLVPIFTHDNLFFGHLIIENRTAEDEVLRYLKAWHILGLPRGDLRELVSSALKNYKELENSNPLHPLDPLRSDSASFADGLMYWPFLRQLDGIPIAGSDGEHTNSQVVDKVMGWYEEQQWKRSIPSTPCLYALVSEVYWDRATKLHQSHGFVLVFQNDCRRIYRFLPTTRDD
jgi:hypothetical protein